LQGGAEGICEIVRPIPAEETLTYHLPAKTARKPEARVDMMRWLEWY
jgi:hypothetical protein